MSEAPALLLDVKRLKCAVACHYLTSEDKALRHARLRAILCRFDKHIQETGSKVEHNIFSKNLVS